MFTGIIQTTGRIVNRILSSGAGKLIVESANPFSDLEYGESIAVNGACLTLEQFQGNVLTFHTLEETLRRTNLGRLPVGGIVNLERAMQANGRFGGHVVTGHVDACAAVLSCGTTGSDTEFVIEAPPEVKPYLVQKGCICIDGISLTIASLDGDRFSVRIIPVTWKETALRFRNKGALVNLEADLIGKYVRHQVEQMLHPEKNAAPEKRELTMNDLYEAGF